MLAHSVVEQIKELLAAGRKQRAVARQTGVSRGSVHAIANDKRRVHDRPATAEEEPLPTASGPRVRCTGCGGLTQLPCRVCHVRSQPRDKASPGDDELPGLALRDPHRVRYEQVRRGVPPL